MSGGCTFLVSQIFASFKPLEKNQPGTLLLKPPHTILCANSRQFECGKTFPKIVLPKMKIFFRNLIPQSVFSIPIIINVNC